MKKKILYIYSHSASFIEKDIHILSKSYRVISPSYLWRNKFLTPFYFFQQILFLIRHLPSSHAVFIMFGGYWSLLPSVMGKMMNKKVYIILGGTDCVSFPNLNYGSLRKPLLATVIRYSYHLAERLIPVDESLVYYKYDYYENKTHDYQGYKYFFPEIKTHYKVVHNGFDPDFFDPKDISKKQNSFIVLANITSFKVMKLKGVDLLIKIAKSLKQASFTIIGINKQFINEIGQVPNNVILKPHQSKEEFLSDLSQSEFIVQLSISEGFPNALCEAMLCKCIPIGSEVGGIPNIIGDTGFVLKSSNLSYLRTEFNKIARLTEQEKNHLADGARKRVVENFHISQRQERLIELVEKNK